MLKGFMLASAFLSLVLFLSDAFALRDPFQPTPKVLTSILTQYPLSALSMVGTMTRGDERFAIIRAPDKKVYPVTVGNPIGEDNGYVLQIMPQQVLIQESTHSSDSDARLPLRQVVSLWLIQVQ